MGWLHPSLVAASQAPAATRHRAITGPMSWLVRGAEEESPVTHWSNDGEWSIQEMRSNDNRLDHQIHEHAIRNDKPL